MAGAVTFNWNAEAYQAKVQSELQRRLKASSIVVSSHAKRLLSIAGTGQMVNGQIVPSTAGNKKKKIRGAFPSKPGEPPHKQTGRLRASVAYEVGEKTARVGTNVKYGRWLELGTTRMAARPWLRRSLIECRRQINAIFGKRI